MIRNIIIGEVNLICITGTRMTRKPNLLLPSLTGLLLSPTGQRPPLIFTLVRADYFQNYFHIDHIKLNITTEVTEALKELRENN